MAKRSARSPALLAGDEASRRSETATVTAIQSGLSLREGIRLRELKSQVSPLTIEIEGLQMMMIALLAVAMPMLPNGAIGLAYDALFIPLLGIFAGSWLAVVVMLLDARLVEAIWCLGWHVRMLEERAIHRPVTALCARAFYAAQARGIIDQANSMRRTGRRVAQRARRVLKMSGPCHLLGLASIRLRMRVARWKRRRDLVNQVNLLVAIQRAHRAYDGHDGIGTRAARLERDR